MKVLFPHGCRYELSSRAPGYSQLLEFRCDVELPCIDGSRKFVQEFNGTTTEEVLDVLIDRMQCLQSQLPCGENAVVITKLEEALMWLRHRTADRRRRNVEGTPNP